MTNYPFMSTEKNNICQIFPKVDSNNLDASTKIFVNNKNYMSNYAYKASPRTTLQRAM